jgi:hypothetical protein
MDARAEHDRIQAMLPRFPNQPNDREDFDLMVMAHGKQHVADYCHKAAQHHLHSADWYWRMSAHLRDGSPDPRESVA